MNAQKTCSGPATASMGLFCSVPGSSAAGTKELLGKQSCTCNRLACLAPRWSIPIAAEGRFEFRPSDWLTMTALATSAATHR